MEKEFGKIIKKERNAENCFITIFISHSFLSRTWQVRPEVCSLSAKSFAHFPVTDVKPSGLVSVIPSIGFSPFLEIAK